MPVIVCSEGFNNILIRFVLLVSWLHLVSGLAFTHLEPLELRDAHKTGQPVLNLLQVEHRRYLAPPKRSKVKRMKTIMSNVTRELEDDSNETTWLDLITRVTSADGQYNILIGAVCIGAVLFLAVFILVEIANSDGSIDNSDDGSMKAALDRRQGPPSQVQSQASLAALNSRPSMMARLMQNTQDQAAGRPPGSQPGSRPGSRPGSGGGSPKTSTQSMPDTAAETPGRFSMGNAAGHPPPICKELILPHSEAWFAVSFGHLDTVHSGEFDLYGLSGKPLLRANVASNANATGRVSISMKPAKSPELASVTCTMSADGRKQMSIASKKNLFYGELVNRGGPGVMNFVLIYQGAQVLSLIFDDASCHFRLLAPDGTQLACASKRVSTEVDDIFCNEDHLEVRVNIGADAVLALVCIMGAVVFGAHGVSSFSVPTSAR